MPSIKRENSWSPANWNGTWEELRDGFLARWGDEPGTVVLESQVMRPGLGRWSLLAASPRIVVSAADGRLFESEERGVASEVGALSLESLASVLGVDRSLNSSPCSGDGMPPAAPWLGYFGYEAGAYIAESPAPARIGPEDLPDVWLARQRYLALWDHRNRCAWLANEESCEILQSARAALSGVSESAVGDPQPSQSPELVSPPMPEAYCDAVERVREYILAGDIFQANVTWRFEERSSTRPADLFRAFHDHHPASHAALIVLDENRAIVSASPELYLRTRPDGCLETRPIKGTARRDRLAEPGIRKNQGVVRALLKSAKDRAEHVMIVDVKRNDLGRLAQLGEVRVERLIRPLSLEHLIHLESCVSAAPRAEVTALDALAALYPGGSITGAPKIHACEIIREVERTRRNVYTGCVGWIHPDGVHLNIAIRTAYRTDGTGRWFCHAGGGIVADSTPEAEWSECLTKIKGLRLGLDSARRRG